MHRGPHVDAVQKLGAAAHVQEQRLAAVIKELPFIGGAGIKGQHLFTELLHPGDDREIQRVVHLGQFGQVGFQRDQLLLGAGVVDHRVVALELLLAVQQAGGQFAARVHGQIRRVVIQRRSLGVEHGKRLGGTDVNGEKTVGIGGITHAGKRGNTGGKGDGGGNTPGGLLEGSVHNKDSPDLVIGLI